MFDNILELSHDARVLISTETRMKLNPNVPLKDETMNSSTLFWQKDRFFLGSFIETAL